MNIGVQRRVQQPLWLDQNYVRESNQGAHLENIVVLRHPIPIPPLSGVFVNVGVRLKDVEAILVARKIRSHDNLPIILVGLVKDPLDEVGPHGSRMLEEVKYIPNTATFVLRIPHALEEASRPMTSSANHHRLVVVLL